MITIYGSHLCHNCRDLRKTLDVHSYPYVYKDITEDLKNLKEFLKLRDTLPCYDEAKENGKIGIPTLITDEGEVTLQWEEYVSSKGMTPLSENKEDTLTCGVNQKDC